MIQSLRRKIYNFFYWGWKLRNDVSWDNTSIYSILGLKLSQLKYSCFINGHHVWSEKNRHYKALLECIKLCEVLCSEERPYSERFHNEFGYGRGLEFEDIPGTDLCKLLVNNNTPFYKKQSSAAYKNDDRLIAERRARLFQLLDKWSGHWWN